MNILKLMMQTGGFKTQEELLKAHPSEAHFFITYPHLKKYMQQGGVLPSYQTAGATGCFDQNNNPIPCPPGTTPNTQIFKEIDKYKPAELDYKARVQTNTNYPLVIDNIRTTAKSRPNQELTENEVSGMYAELTKKYPIDNKFITTRAKKDGFIYQNPIEGDNRKTWTEMELDEARPVIYKPVNLPYVVDYDSNQSKTFNNPQEAAAFVEELKKRPQGIGAGVTSYYQKELGGFLQRGGNISTMGYRDDSPYKNRPYIDIHSPSGLIDMSNTGQPLMANGKYLPPYSGMHQFNTNIVRETPMKYLQNGGKKISQQDSVRHQAGKIMEYEKFRGSATGDGLTDYGNPALGNAPTKKVAVDWFMDNIAPKLGSYKTAMEKGEAGDFMYNSGKDARAYAIQEYYKKTDPNNMNQWQDKQGNWKYRNDPTKFDEPWKAIQQLPVNDRRVLINKGRDWYYQNINNPAPGVPNDAYKNTWYGRIWNTNDYNEFDPKNPKFTPAFQKGGPLKGITPYNVQGLYPQPTGKNIVPVVLPENIDFGTRPEPKPEYFNSPIAYKLALMKYNQDMGLSTIASTPPQIAIAPPVASTPVSSAYKGPSIVDWLKSKGKDSSLKARKGYADEMQYMSYSPTASDNTNLLKRMQAENVLPDIVKEVASEVVKKTTTTDPVTSKPGSNKPLVQTPEPHSRVVNEVNGILGLDWANKKSDPSTWPQQKKVATELDFTKQSDPKTWPATIPQNRPLDTRSLYMPKSQPVLGANSIPLDPSTGLTIGTRYVTKNGEVKFAGIKNEEQLKGLQKVYPSLLDYISGKNLYKQGGIHINPANKGKFTQAANTADMGVQEYARHIMANPERYSPLLRKRANFALNASKFKH